MNSGDQNARGLVRAPSSLWLVLATFAICGMFAAGLVTMSRRKQTSRRHREKLHEKSLQDTFPASDPPASQYFDIPVNRQ